MRQDIVRRNQGESTMAGAIGPFMTGLGRSPLALIRRKPIKPVTGAVSCPHCGQRVNEGKACCKACAKGKKCKSELKEAKAPKKLPYGTKVRARIKIGGRYTTMDGIVFKDQRGDGDGLWIKGTDNRNYRNMELVKVLSLREARAVPSCIPLTPPDPDCTLAGGWAKEMKKRNLRLIKRKNDSRKKRL
jgi:hypothetical protein